MADNSMASYSGEANLARVLSGFSGGPFFNKPVITSRTIVEGYPSSVDQKLENKPFPQPTPIDSWNQRR